MFAKLFSSLLLTISSWFGVTSTSTSTSTEMLLPPQAQAELPQVAQENRVAGGVEKNQPKEVKTPPRTSQKEMTTPAGALSQDELLALASPVDTTKLPLGDYKYVTDAPKKGYVYLCNARKDNPGSMVNGPWMHGSTWNLEEKVSVSGNVSWPNAAFTNAVLGVTRMLTGNGLPVGHATGVFPVSSNDPASRYDKNPNTISVQTLKKSLPAQPTYSDTPYCMGGEVGIMLTGVALFNAFDAGLRDAAAHEVQDSCEGHPQGTGEYHYHSLSSCFADAGVSTVLGYALDGFPITGPKVADGKYLSTDDLDVCHGITSEILEDGAKKVTYHYVMTSDFPYSASCFRGRPSSLQVVSGGQGGEDGSAQKRIENIPTSQASAPAGRTPPQEAISACSDKGENSSCSFQTPLGGMSGICRMIPEGGSACVPQR